MNGYEVELTELIGWSLWSLKCETLLVAKMPETRQHFFVFSGILLHRPVRPESANINSSVTCNAFSR